MSLPISGTKNQISREFWGEFIAIFVLILLFAFVSFKTIELLPQVWGDEPGYTDPAANLAFGKGFNSTTWYAQKGNEFWAGNVPLHELTLALWIKWLGFGVWQVRSINILWVCSSLLMLWVFVRKTQILKSYQARIAMVVALLGCWTVDVATRCGRPDGITIFLFSLALLLSQISNPLFRRAVLACVGFLFPIAGLQLAFYAIIFSGLIILFTRWRYLAEILALGVGIGLGGISLLGLYSATGSLAGFRASIRPHTGIHSEAISKFSGFTLDISLWFLALALIFFLLVQILSTRSLQNRVFIFGLSALFLVPLGMLVVGKFSHHYTWMAYFPAAVGLLAGLEVVKVHPFIRWTTITLMGVATLFGIPKTLVMIARLQAHNPSAAIEKWLDGYISPEDRVFVDWAGYYTAKTHAKEVYTRAYLPMFSSSEAEGITLVAIQPEFEKETFQAIGGNWHLLEKKLVFHLAGLRGFHPYEISVYRKK